MEDLDQVLESPRKATVTSYGTRRSSKTYLLPAATRRMINLRRKVKRRYVDNSSILKARSLYPTLLHYCTLLWYNAPQFTIAKIYGSMGKMN